ncbi:MAG: hypothetical protein WC832_01940 [Anaerolineales bacterium]
MKTIVNLSPLDKFERWYVHPLKVLLQIENGDGGFIAFGATLALYERYIRAKLKTKSIKGSPENFRKEASDDLGVKQYDFQIWWEIFRDGINHQASPKHVRRDGVDYTWHFREDFEAVPQRSGNEFQLNPGKFIELVIQKYYADPIALTATDTYALGDIEFEIKNL